MDKATIRANVLKDLEGYICDFYYLADIPEVDILGNLNGVAESTCFRFFNHGFCNFIRLYREFKIVDAEKFITSAIIDNKKCTFFEFHIYGANNDFCKDIERVEITNEQIYEIISNDIFQNESYNKCFYDQDEDAINALTEKAESILKEYFERFRKIHAK